MLGTPARALENVNEYSGVWSDPVRVLITLLLPARKYSLVVQVGAAEYASRVCLTHKTMSHTYRALTNIRLLFICLNLVNSEIKKVTHENTSKPMHQLIFSVLGIKYSNTRDRDKIFNK